MDQKDTLQTILHTVQETRESVRENREIINVIMDSVATKNDLQTVRDDLQKFATKDDINATENRMIEHVDGFVALYQKHEVELAAVVSRQHRLEEKLEQVIKHLNLDIA